MKNLTLLTLSLVGLCALPSLSLALDAAPKPTAQAERRGAPGGGPAARLKVLTEKLNLTQEQQDKVKAITEKNGPELRGLMAKGRENLTDDDKAKVRELMKGQMEEIGAILTPEQKEKLKELRQERAR